MADGNCSHVITFFEGAALTLGFFGFLFGAAALAAHKRNRLLIRRMADDMHTRMGTKPR